MAEHIKTVQERNYVEQTATGHLVPTNLGIALVNGEKHIRSWSFIFLLSVFF